MKFKQAAAVLFGALLSFSVAADTLKLKEGHPDSYIVKKGDTLWDISAYFLDSPWLWPRLWQTNPQVKNPHLIYPGDKLYLTWVDGQPQLGRKRLKKMSPKPRIDEKRSAVPTIPLNIIEPFLTKDHIIDESLLKGAPRVMGQNSKSTRIMKGDIFYGEGQFDANVHYGIYRVGTTFTDKTTKEVLGSRLTYIASAQVSQSENVTATERVTPMLVTKSTTEAKLGDIILPIPEYDVLPAFFIPTSTPQDMRGYIVDSLSEKTALGRGDIVVINQGRREQIEPGAIFSIKRPGAQIVERGDKVVYKEDANTFEKIFLSGDDSLTLPEETIGMMMVFKVYEKSSIAIIVRGRELVGRHFDIEGVDF
ncbi:LysM peptidoglycan-binding domain-containing protein [Motilimonas cestriensis]|uniref:LysM peptidoglycan-binding domain-containing protein n=1 Tax=Motilimonas cestriensis TaxID=2742685 RepID=A0ABS8W5J0_9GAMM|nr:LysM domain-containing protein [Motilimonas cestriensis]MCE2594239.1 LysM peptidoglycan-binding domain-containing protein [Motilimonas cestriensis]